MKRSSAVIFVSVLAIVAVALHLTFGWYAAVNEAEAEGVSALWGDYMIQWARDTFENLQSEFWQLAVQFALLAGLLQWLGIRAYEEDVEELKQELKSIKSVLLERQTDQESRPQ